MARLYGDRAWAEIFMLGSGMGYSSEWQNLKLNSELK
jgi:hypothetical protein